HEVEGAPEQIEPLVVGDAEAAGQRGGRAREPARGGEDPVVALVDLEAHAERRGEPVAVELAARHAPEERVDVVEAHLLEAVGEPDLDVVAGIEVAADAERAAALELVELVAAADAEQAQPQAPAAVE